MAAPPAEAAAAAATAATAAGARPICAALSWMRSARNACCRLSCCSLGSCSLVCLRASRTSLTVVDRRTCASCSCSLAISRSSLVPVSASRNLQ
eukprot:scaffold93624_cov63-Phaeocystis_antarctica.AAC.1